MDQPSLDASSPNPRKRHWLWPTRFRVIGGLLIALAIWGWLDVRKRGAVDPNDPYLHKTDLTVYTEAGAAFFDGRDPYAVSNPRGWRYLYPPLFAILLAPLHKLDTQDQVMVWFAISVIACWGCYRELMRIARAVVPADRRAGHFGMIPTWLGTLAVAAAALPALNCMQRGQVGVAKLYLLLLAFRLIVERGGLWKTLLGGSLLALDVTLKITPIVPACIIVWQLGCVAWFSHRQSDWKHAGAGAFGLAGGLALWLLLVPGAIVGWRANLDHLHTWYSEIVLKAENTNETDFAGNSTTFRNQSLANAAYRCGNWVHYMFAGGPHDLGPEQLRRGGRGLLMDARWSERVIFGIRALAGCLLLVASFQLARRGEPLDLAAAFGLSCVATLVVFTIARGHYYLLYLPANAFIPLWLFQAGRTRWAWILAILPTALVIGHYAALDYSGRVGLLGLGTTAWYFTTCILLIRAPRVKAAVVQRQDKTFASELPQHAQAA